MDVYVWKKNLKRIHNKESEFEEKEKIVFPIILGQCSTSLWSQLEGMPNFIEISKK